MRRNLSPAAPHPGQQRHIFLGRDMRAAGTVLHLLQARGIEGCHRIGIGLVEGPVLDQDVRVHRGRMVVECQGRSVGPRENMGDQRLGLVAEGFPAQLDAVVCGQARAKPLQRADDLPGGVDAAKAGLQDRVRAW